MLENCGLYTTSLLAQRSSKKCTSIACWTAPLFLLAQKKLSKKMLYHMVASRCVATR